MDSYPRSPRKLQKRSASISPCPRPRHSLENISLGGSSVTFGDTVTLSDQTETQSHLDTHKCRISSHSSRQLLCHPADPELGAAPLRHRSPLLWTTELLVLFFGLLCLLAIIIILHRADGNEPPQWPLNTNLNTIIAFLASLAKVTFVMAIAEGLGQLKWIWFLAQPRPLSDFQAFDEATRGGWGSWKLLFRLKGFCATLGALILVSGLLTSTFTQMAITYPVIQAEAKNGTETATVERATGFSVYDGNRLLPGAFEAVREQQAVYVGGFYPPDEEAPHLSPACPSGDCVWPTYGSLAVCSDVANLTATAGADMLAELRNVTARRLGSFYAGIKSNGDIYGWANFQAQALPGFYPVILGPMAPRPGSGAFNESVGNLILNDNFVAYPVRMLNASAPLDMDAFHFLGLTFWWCAKSYSSRVRAGEHVTTEISTRSEIKPPAAVAAAQSKKYDTHTLNMAWSPGFYPCYTAGTCNETFGPASVELLAPHDVPEARGEGAGGATYSVNVWTALTVSGLLAATMWDLVLMDPSHGVVTSNGGGVAKAFALSVLGDFMAPAPPPPEDQLAGARRVAGNIARTITNLVRKESGRFAATAADAAAGGVVQGTVYTPQARVRVHWGWICVLSVQLVCTFVFLGLTIWTTGRKGVEVMKSSSFATLVALQPGVREELGGLGGFGELKQRAERVGLLLERGEGGVISGLGNGRARAGEENMAELSGDGGAGVKEEVQVDTRRLGMVFEGYHSGYPAQSAADTEGGASLRRLMTND